jgi:hypothetical protein
MSSHERKLYGDEFDEETERWLIENDKNFEDELRIIDKYDLEEKNGAYVADFFDISSRDPDSWRDDAMFRRYEETQFEPGERKIGRRRNFDANCLSIDFT